VRLKYPIWIGDWFVNNFFEKAKNNNFAKECYFKHSISNKVIALLYLWFRLSECGIVLFVVLVRRCMIFPSCCGICLVHIEVSVSINCRFNQWFGHQRSRFGYLGNFNFIILFLNILPLYTINLNDVSLFTNFELAPAKHFFSLPF
jgi:hypothetical protein